MRVALTPNQSESDKSKHTYLKSVLTFSGQCCLRFVFRLLTADKRGLFCTSLYEYVGACYGRFVTPPPSSKTKEKTTRSEVPAG